MNDAPTETKPRRFGLRCLAAAASALLAAGCASTTDTRSAPAFGALPVAWRELVLDEALAAANAEGRDVLVLFTSSFSETARSVEGKTFADPRVAALVASGTVPIRADVAWVRELAARFQVRVLPTILLLARDGTELERWAGEQNAASLASELRAALGGDTTLARARARPPGAIDDLKSRLELGRQLASQGRYEAALAEHLAILRDAFANESGARWTAGKRRKQRVNFREVVRAIADLRAAHPPAARALLELQEVEREALLNSPHDRTRATRFVAVCRATEDAETLLATFRLLPSGAGRDALAGDAFDLLFARRAYDEAAAILPVERVLEHIDKNSDMPLVTRGVFVAVLPPLSGTLIHRLREAQLRRNVRHFEAFAGARRDGEAGEVARAILRKRNSQSAIEALCIAARRARPEDHAAFIEALGVPQLVAEERRR